MEQIKVTDESEAALTFVPEFPRYPPELVWMREPDTDIPGLVLNTGPENSRIAFLPADLDRQLCRHNIPDHSKLLINLVRWASKGEIPLVVEGTGLIDCYLYHQPNQMILHIVNMNNEGAWRPPLHELSPIGPLNIRIKLSDDVLGEELHLLVANQKLSVALENGWVSFRINSILDHEVIVVA